MNNLSWFAKWYANQICKNTGNPLNINITTIENSAWSVKIDIKQTPYSKIVLKKEIKIKSDYNWFSIEIKNNEFLAEGDFTKLDFLIGKFREVIGETLHKLSIKDDFFFSSDIQGFIFENDEDTIVFLHYTNKKRVAEKIIKTGLEFTYSFDKTATKVKNNLVDLSYNHYVRKQFGENVVVMAISKKLYQFYIDKINQSDSPILRVEEILSEKPVYFNAESEEVYTLNHKFIKGYFNYKNQEIVKNKEFDPFFDSKIFLENIKSQ